MREFAAAGICWNDAAGTELDGTPLKLWEYPSGEPLHEHPWIQGQVWMRAKLSQILADELSRLAASPRADTRPEPPDVAPRPLPTFTAMDLTEVLQAIWRGTPTTPNRRKELQQYVIDLAQR